MSRSVIVCRSCGCRHWEVVMPESSNVFQSLVRPLAHPCGSLICATCHTEYHAQIAIDPHDDLHEVPFDGVSPPTEAAVVRHRSIFERLFGDTDADAAGIVPMAVLPIGDPLSLVETSLVVDAIEQSKQDAPGAVPDVAVAPEDFHGGESGGAGAEASFEPAPDPPSSEPSPEPAAAESPLTASDTDAL